MWVVVVEYGFFSEDVVATSPWRWLAKLKQRRYLRQNPDAPTRVEFRRWF